MSYTIAQAAEICGLTTHTLRYYDKEGLLPFVERNNAGIRKFKDADFEWLALISCLKSTSMPVKRIRQFIDWCMQGDATFEQRLNVLEEQKKQVEAQMEMLHKCMEKIEHKIKYYQTALEAGPEAVQNKRKSCLEQAKREMAVYNQNFRSIKA